jgi:hypothetical protein
LALRSAVRRSAGLAAVVLLLAACGGSPASKPPPALSEREWVDSAGRFVEELENAILLTTHGGSDLRSARRALADDSDLYAMLVAYDDLGGCKRTLLLNVGAPPVAFRDVESTLATACRRFQRAAALFSRAVKSSDPAVLLAATRLALGASPLLYDAKARLQGSTSNRG